MDKQYDFKAALAAMKIEFAQFDTFGTTYRVVHFNDEPNHIKALKAALRLADRLQSGEVSHSVACAGMWAACDMEYDEYNDLSISTDDAAGVFKAMAAQMIKEVEDEG